MPEAQVGSLACPSGALLAGQSSVGSAGDTPGDTAAWGGDAWNALQLGLHQVAADLSHRMEECLQNNWETK